MAWCGNIFPFLILCLSCLFISFATDCRQHDGAAGNVTASQLQGPRFNPELRILRGFSLGSPGFLSLFINMQVDSLAMLNCPWCECIRAWCPVMNWHSIWVNFLASHAVLLALVVDPLGSDQDNAVILLKMLKMNEWTSRWLKHHNAHHVVRMQRANGQPLGGGAHT